MPAAIATPHRLATEAGEAALRAGGSAVDAALTAAAVLSVAYPHMTGLGGDLFALVARPDGTVTAVQGAGAAGSRVDVEDVRRRSQGGVMPWRGPDTVTVPGAVDAWGAVAALGARLEWTDLLAPAIKAARDGVPVARRLGEAMRADPDVLGPPTDVLRQPRLATTLEAIAAGGPRALYDGDLASRFSAGLEELGCAITGSDLAGHANEGTDPLSARFHDVEVMTAPPPSQGYVLLALLGALESLPQVPDPFGPWAATIAHLVRMAGEERDRVLADPRFAGVDVAALMAGGEARLAAAREASLARAAGPSGDTVGVVATDDDGGAVSIIQSLYGSFGSGLVEPSTGIVLHNRGAAFSLDPDLPNVLAPGKRPAHTLMPVLVRRGGSVAGVLGTMGARAQPHIHLQVLLRLLRAQEPAAAVAAPRIVVEGRRVVAESGALAAAGAALRLAGFEIQDAGDLSEAVGHAQVVWNGVAGSDPRADGMAAPGLG